ncbi:hypothetical protein IE81DRAFT_52063 [Ceraceosorus guamensis]|uniref:Uncharacterized protein n=1 Tax=Ceraceosorus guamensis TaxID=1522189 RepID=A0A316W460_9BASI|nr:hypothetical protein IE81DRAFT_52063 [Ceraceosorus guamensis]PWN43908.1 hypothetical protein IE81DRAFT_52063 [Ceraceosorus guamensis]
MRAFASSTVLSLSPSSVSQRSFFQSSLVQTSKKSFGTAGICSHAATFLASTWSASSAAARQQCIHAPLSSSTSLHPFLLLLPFSSRQTVSPVSPFPRWRNRVTVY